MVEGRRLGPLAALACVALLGGCAGGILVPVPVIIPAPAFATEEVEPDARLAEGHHLLAAGDAEAALRAFGQAATSGAGPEALAAMGTANIALGRLGQAEPLLRRAAERDPGSAPAWNNLGVVLLETGRPREAAASFRRAFALDGGATAGVRENLVRAEALLEAPGPVAAADEDAVLAVVSQRDAAASVTRTGERGPR